MKSNDDFKYDRILKNNLDGIYKGKCGVCGENVYHAYPYWTRNPDKIDSKPLHDDCAFTYYGWNTNVEFPELSEPILGSPEVNGSINIDFGPIPEGDAQATFNYFDEIFDHALTNALLNLRIIHQYLYHRVTNYTKYQRYLKEEYRKNV